MPDFIHTTPDRFIESGKAAADIFLKEYRGSIMQTDHVRIKSMIRKRPVDAHKNVFGHALMIAGSHGKSGAALLASKAAMRTGCGLITAMVPEDIARSLSIYLPEAMSINRPLLKDIDNGFTIFDAIGIGPGAGITSETADLLKYVLQNIHKPVVIDADAITILAAHQDWYSFLGPNVILTPHPGEFDRLTRVHHSAYERFLTQVYFAEKFQVNILLKGKNTSMAYPGNVIFNTSGNDGMATAGSGDVLTGIISGLCAQGYEPYEAMIVGTYIHGYAGDMASIRLSRQSMLASDIIEHICDFYHS